MENWILQLIKSFNSINESIFSPFHEIIETVGLEHWIAHSIIDCIQMIPFLFIIFVIIEVFEYCCANKMSNIANVSNRLGPFIGSLVASFPQCGFSVIASTLYTKRYITKGTLLAVYIATSDEAIPVILADPNNSKLVLPIFLIKIFIAVTAGYVIDTFIKIKKSTKDNSRLWKFLDDETEGCHHHHIVNKTRKDLIIHPILHTLNIFIFILFVTLLTNYLIHISGGPTELSKYLLGNTIFQPMVAAMIGLVPSCAISVGLALLYIKGAISFGSVIAGLSSSAGLGLLVLVKKNSSIKDSVKIVLLLLFISMLSGILIQLIYH